MSKILEQTPLVATAIHVRDDDGKEHRYLRIVDPIDVMWLEPTPRSDDEDDFDFDFIRVEAGKEFDLERMFLGTLP